VKYNQSLVYIVLAYMLICNRLD